uniref:AN1-type zinc finger protein 4 n=1 Tax=Cacopsylla melanoneura TaxID=428564 RepID=A0A8D9FG49_9HEMI
MSHHGFKLNFAVDHELLTIFIETLTGSTFEMVVTPIDSIASIKAKIQRMEGILVSQQHLLYNMQELDDQSTVQDYGIQDGSTIKLVLSMRGGPLGTARRVLPLDDVVKEFVELERNDIEDLPPGSKLAIIVFRDDDSVNMFRVLEHTDGSFSPLSPSSTNISSNKTGDPKQGPSNSVVKSMSDNLKTKNKMEDLKFQLEALSLQKKSDNSTNNAEDSSLTSRFPPIKINQYSNSSKEQCAAIPALSQVPVLPQISTAAAMPPTSQLRPRSSPATSGKLTGEQICQILSDAGKHRSQLLSSHCTSSTINRLPQSSTSDMMDYDAWSSRGGGGGGVSGSGAGGKTGSSLALYSPGPPSRSMLNPLLSENNILAASTQTKKLPVNEYKVVTPSSTSSMYKLSPITSAASTPNTSNSSVATSSQATENTLAVKKKSTSRSRCSQCNKKLNISGTYTCRCERLFCSKHRYSEAHACTYDYKKEGKKQIAEANPLVTAPKITKF